MFRARNARTKLRELVMESEYDEIVSLTLMNRNMALELAKLLEDSDTEVRENAAETIARMGKDDLQVPEAVEMMMPRLQDLLKNRKAQAREAAARALVGIAWNWLMWEDFGQLMEPVIPRFIGLLNDPDAKVRRKALEGARVLSEWIEDGGGDVEWMGLVSPWISGFLKDSELRGDAVWTLRAIAHKHPEMAKPIISDVIELLKDPKSHVRLGASATLRYVAETHPKTARPALPSLLILLDDPDWRVSQNAAIVLGFVAGQTAEVAELVAPKLTELLRDDRPSFRADAAIALARIGKITPEMIRPAVPQLTKLLEDRDEKVRQSAATALKVFTL